MSQQVYEMRTPKNSKSKKNKNLSSATSKSNLWTAVAISCLAITLIAGIAAYFILSGSFASKHDPNTFLPGITVNGVSIEGKTIEEAKIALKDAEAACVKDITVAMTLDGKPYTLSASDLSFSYDMDEILNQALALCKNDDGTIIRKDAKQLAQTGQSYSITYTVDIESIKTAVSTLASQLNRTGKDASMGVYNESNPPSVTDEEGNPVEVTVAGRFYYVPEENGLEIKQEDLVQLIEEHINAKSTDTIEIPFNVITPTQTMASLQASVVLRSSFKTTYTSNANRDKNLIKATGICNGTVVQPGETFSANDTLGPRTTANGWLDAPAIIYGGAGHEDQPGGGVCQISTTMYNAVVTGDLEVVFRRNHSTPSAYIGGGLDATINTGTIDFKWKNNTDAPIYIFMWVDESKKTVNCELYGKSMVNDEYDEIKLIGAKQSSITPPAGIKYVYDEEVADGKCVLYNKAITGSIWQSYKVYYKNGTEVKREKCALSTYNAHQETWHYGKGWTTPTPTVTPTVTPTPTPSPTPTVTPTP